MSEESGRLMPDDKPWRRGLHKFSKQSLTELKASVQNYKPLEAVPVNQARILMVGQIGAGKSSFFNTINSIYRGHVTSQAASGNDPESLTTKFRTYEVRADRVGAPMNFRLCDTMGIEDGDKGLDITDIHYILDGAISDSFQFQTGKRLEEVTDYKIAELRNRIHVLAIVMDANLMDFLPESVTVKLRSIYNHARKRAIPALVVLTKIDNVCPFVKDDATKVYHSSNVLESVTKAADIVRIPAAQVVPMKNYDTETELDQAVDILALFAMRQLLRLADSYFDEQMAILGISLQQKEMKPHGDTTVDRSYQHGHPSSEPLPTGWEERKDANGGNFYLNHNTGETSHVRPGITTQRDGAYLLDDSSTRKIMQELPPGWEQFTDKDGRPFYLNAKLGTTTKERPLPDKPRRTTEEASQLPPGWEELKDQNGCPFYLNKNTGTTTTKKPPMAETRVHKSDATLAPGWTLLKNKNGQEYYFNAETGKTTRQKPVFQSAESNQQTSLPPGWQVLTDPEGNALYFETKTGKTTPNKPMIQPVEDNSTSSSVDGSIPPGWQILREADGKALYLETKTGKVTRDKPSAAGTLPPGWKILKDADGNPMYYEASTGKTTLTKPTMPPTDQNVGDASATLPPGWKLLRGEGGKAMYFEETSGTVTAQRPMALSRGSCPQQPPGQPQPSPIQPAPAGWHIQNDPASGRPYYVNDMSGATSWDRPPDVSTAAPAMGDTKPQTELPEGWETVAAHGAQPAYQYNRNTGESRWIKP